MSKLFNSYMDLNDAKSLFFSCVQPINRIESVPVEGADGRIIAAVVVSEMNVPHYRRAAMDGFAVRAEDTISASPTSPVILELTGGDVATGTCRRVHTGSVMPEDSDAVIMLEDSRSLVGSVEITAQAHPGKHVGIIGEDVAQGEIIFKKGHLLRPADLAVLASIGMMDVEVYHKPLIAIIPTGEEVLPRGSRINPGQVWETNSLMTAAYVKRMGGNPRVSNIITDDVELIHQALSANSDADMLIICGGTSVGERDQVPAAIKDMGELLVHGVAISPGKPVALGTVKGKPVICMPGYPVAGLVALLVFGKTAIQKLGHIPLRPETIVKLPLREKITSRPGFTTYVRVRMRGGRVEPVMTSGAGILSSVALADGYVVVPHNIEGFSAGTEVEVIFF